MNLPTPFQKFKQAGPLLDMCVIRQQFVVIFQIDDLRNESHSCVRYLVARTIRTKPDTHVVCGTVDLVHLHYLNFLLILARLVDAQGVYPERYRLILFSEVLESVVEIVLDKESFFLQLALIHHPYHSMSHRLDWIGLGVIRYNDGMFFRSFSPVIRKGSIRIEACAEFPVIDSV